MRRRRFAWRRLEACLSIILRRLNFISLSLFYIRLTSSESSKVLFLSLLFIIIIIIITWLFCSILFSVLLSVRFIKHSVSPRLASTSRLISASKRRTVEVFFIIILFVFVLFLQFLRCESTACSHSDCKFQWIAIAERDRLHTSHCLDRFLCLWFFKLYHWLSLSFSLMAKRSSNDRHIQSILASFLWSRLLTS